MESNKLTEINADERGGCIPIIGCGCTGCLIPTTLLLVALLTVVLAIVF